MINITLTQQEVQLVVNCLAKQPYEIVVDALNKIVSQAREQLTKEVENGRTIKDSG